MILTHSILTVVMWGDFMKISSIEIKGFRCFDLNGQVISLDNLTCYIGANASGKTAAMMALVRMFGENQSDRTITVSDFHLAVGEELNSVSERELSIEARLVFPELNDGSTDGISIPETFNQMVVDEPGGAPYCRIRLTATWANDGTPEGDIRQRLQWITSPVGVLDDEASIFSMGASERARIRVVYGAASRDPSRQIRTTTGSMFGRLLKAVDWSDKEQEVKKGLDDLNNLLETLPGIETLNDKLQSAWSALYDGRVAQNVSISPADGDPTALLSSLDAIFRPDELGGKLLTKDLSDGLKALFSLSLPLGLFSVGELLKSSTEQSGFVISVLDTLPLLTIFVVEEPENHLSPHYLGKVLSSLEKTAGGNNAQVILSSHSPSILQRIEPDFVRYFLGNETSSSTAVKEIPLPQDETDEAFKYVREAVRGFPELYFSRLVILGEGPSEEIVLRKIFEASGDPLDVLFISVVPLGGRHVNHFWRLLNGLVIPYITLLDLDYGKRGGGLERINYVRDQLIALGKDEIPESLSEDGQIAHLEHHHDVFFSSPLDLDFSMLEAFPDAYKAQAPSDGGPRLPSHQPGRTEMIRRRARQVLGVDEDGTEDDRIDLYKEDDQALFVWYKYLFLDNSKPVAHLRALIALEEHENWVDSIPDTLARIKGRAEELAR